MDLHRKDFDEFARTIGINEAMKTKIIASLNAKYDSMCQIIDDSPLDQNSRSVWKRMIKANIKRAFR